jgi:diguanylate cyclase
VPAGPGRPAENADRAFVSGLGSEETEPAIVAAVIEMGRALGMTVIAEGVETEEQVERLRTLGCAYAQGFYFARPLVASSVSSLPGARAAR